MSILQQVNLFYLSGCSSFAHRPLHDAVENGKEPVWLLLRFGADPLIADYAGTLPSHQTDDPECLKLLQGVLFDYVLPLAFLVQVFSCVSAAVHRLLGPCTYCFSARFSFCPSFSCWRLGLSSSQQHRECVAYSHSFSEYVLHKRLRLHWQYWCCLQRVVV